MLKKLTALTLCAAVALCTLGCSKKEEEKKQGRLISVTTAAVNVYDEGLNYQGFVKAKDTKNYTFKTGGKISKLYVTQGQKVKAGDPLVSLDTTDMEYAEQISRSNAAIADASLGKTLTSYESNIKDLQINIDTTKKSIETLTASLTTYESGFAAAEAGIAALEKNIAAARSGASAAKGKADLLKDNLEKTKILFEKGAVSQSDLDALSLEYDGAVASYQSAEAQVESLEAQLRSSKSSYEGLKAEYAGAKNQLASAENQLASLQNNLAMLEKTKTDDVESVSQNKNIAEINRRQYQDTIDDSELFADLDGTVMSVQYKEGELIASGYPAVVIKSDASVVTIGVSAEDRTKLTVGMSAEINGSIEGTVDSISEYPDENTRTYSVDISFSDKSLAMGELTEVFIPIEEKTGAFIPLESVINIDGIDYVYTVGEDNTVSRTQVTLGVIKENTVQVLDLEDNARVAASGIRQLKENETVTVKE